MDCPPALLRRVSSSPAATAELAARLAPELAAGDTLLLSGDLGSGKTHFARALIQARLAAFDAVEDVPSPSFTLVQTYHAGDLEIWHCDLYRLSGPDDVLELGLDDAFSEAVCLIEWPERLNGFWPRDAVWLTFSTDPDAAETRRITLHAAEMTPLAKRLMCHLEAL
jgi:tRNA threonylcarbamoyladenosine biosynthesis protein TsaE